MIYSHDKEFIQWFTELVILVTNQIDSNATNSSLYRNMMNFILMIPEEQYEGYLLHLEDKVSFKLKYGFMIDEIKNLNTEGK